MGGSPAAAFNILCHVYMAEVEFWLWHMQECKQRAHTDAIAYVTALNEMTIDDEAYCSSNQWLSGQAGELYASSHDNEVRGFALAAASCIVSCGEVCQVLCNRGASVLAFSHVAAMQTVRLSAPVMLLHSACRHDSGS